MREALVLLLSALLAAATAAAQPASRAARDSTAGRPFTAADTLAARVVGGYTSDADPRGFVRVSSLHGIMDVISSRGWQSVGYFDGVSYRGAVRKIDKSYRPLDAPMGELQFRADAAGVITAKLTLAGEPAEEHWRRTVEPSRTAGARNDSLPEPGEYVFVEELPEAIRKVPPSYPGEARRKNVQGTVLLNALVGKDGLVKDVRVTKSISELDTAAITCVRQWEFAPARAHGAPVAVWVAIPIRFTLH